MEEAKAKLDKEAVSTDLAQSEPTSGVPKSGDNAKLLTN
jgi:hypothetical protein